MGKKRKIALLSIFLVIIVGIVTTITVQKKNDEKKLAQEQLNKEIARGEKIRSQKFLDNYDMDNYLELYESEKNVASLSTKAATDRKEKISKVIDDMEGKQLKYAQSSVEKELDQLTDLTNLTYIDDVTKNKIEKKTSESINLSASTSINELRTAIVDLTDFRTNIEENEIRQLASQHLQTKITELNKVKDHKFCPSDKKQTAIEYINKGNKYIEDKKGYSFLTYQSNEIDSLKETIESSFEEEEARQEEEKAEKEKKNPQTYVNTPSYDSLARNPDKYYEEDVKENTKVKFSGKVLQVIEGFLFNKIRLAVNNDYDKVMVVEYFDSQVNGRLLEDDQITVYGYSRGIITYETVLGASKSLPFAIANVIK